MNDVRISVASRAFARGHILFGVIASGISGSDAVLLSCKTIHDFRVLSTDQKVALITICCTHYNLLSRLLLTISQVLGALERLMASVPAHVHSLRACDQASLHAAFCAALQVAL
jgi:hypothetical protein